MKNYEVNEMLFISFHFLAALIGCVCVSQTEQNISKTRRQMWPWRWRRRWPWQKKRKKKACAVARDDKQVHNISDGKNKDVRGMGERMNAEWMMTKWKLGKWVVGLLRINAKRKNHRWHLRPTQWWMRQIRRQLSAHNRNRGRGEIQIKFDARNYENHQNIYVLYPQLKYSLLQLIWFTLSDIVKICLFSAYVFQVLVRLVSFWFVQQQ